MKTKCLFLFCNVLTKDPVSELVFEACRNTLPLVTDGRTLLGDSVLSFETNGGSLACLAPINFVASHNWSALMPDLRRDFSDFDQIVIVNWHQGSKAPERIFCAHTAADVPSGNFSPAHPGLFNALLHAVERERISQGLTDWTTLLEASHWSGIPHGADPNEVRELGIPIVDFEIGSYPADWAHPGAVSVLTRAIASFDNLPEALPSLIFCGGEHFERTASQALFRSEGALVRISHHLPNHWLVAGGYGNHDGPTKLLAAATSVHGGIQGIVFHDNLKGPMKETVRLVAQECQVPCFNHRKLRDPEFLSALSQGSIH